MTIKAVVLGAAASVALALGISGPAGAAEPMIYLGYSHTEEASSKFMEERFAAFKTAHPDIALEIVGYPWRNTFQQLMLQQNSGNPPDVAQISPDWANVFVELGALVDLNDVYGKEWLESRVPVGILELGRVNGKQFSIPETFASIGMVANLKTLNDAGVTTMPKTIAEFTAVLRKVKAANPKSVPFSISTKNNGVMHTDFNTIVWSFGGRLIEADGTVVADNPKALEALDWLVGLMKEGLIAPDIQRSDARQLHAKFETAFSFDAPQVRGFVRQMSGQGDAVDKYITSIPTPVADASITPRAAVYGRSLMLFKKAKPVTKTSPAAIWLDEFVFSEDYQMKSYAYSGNFPILTSVAKTIGDEYVDNWLSHATTAIWTDTAPYMNATDLQKIVAEEYQAAILGMKTSKAALADMSSRLQQALKK